MQDLITSLLILFELLALLWILSKILEVFGKNDRPVSLHRAFFTINLFYSYLTIDIVTSVMTCLCLLALSFSIQPSDFSPSLWVMKWGGIGLILFFYAFQIPIQLVLKLLWPPIFAQIENVLPDWLIQIKGSAKHNTLNDLLLPWIEGMQDTVHWFGLCIVVGAVVPYLGILTVSAILSIYSAAMIESETVQTILALLLLFSDWCGAVVNSALLLNILFVSLID